MAGVEQSPAEQPRAHGARIDRRDLLRIAGVTSAAGFAALAAAPTAFGGPAPAPARPLVNPGFEDGLTGWSVTGTPGAAHVDTGGVHGGSGRLTHWAATAHTATTSQELTGLRPGRVTVTAWVKSGGALGASRLELVQHRRVLAGTAVPNTELGDGWVRIGVSARIGAAPVTLRLTTRAPAGSWVTMDDVSVTAGAGADRIERSVRGADLSSVPKNEDNGAVWFDPRGRRRRPELVLAAAGANLARLKVWVDPADGYNDSAHVVAMARRAQRAGLQILVDFHYSDSWCDPGQQHPPAAWAALDATGTAQAVHRHTTDVLRAIRTAGVRVHRVQVGNEINPGMLWPLGQTWDVDTTDGVTGAQWENLGSFLSAGAWATKEVFPDAAVLLHLTNVNNGIDGLTWWFDQAVAQGVPFDEIGLSFYGYWHGSFADLQGAVSTLSGRYDRDVLVLETAYPWTLTDQPGLPFENVISQPAQLVSGYPATPVGQAAYVRALQDVVAAAPGGRGRGVVYWEPAWTAVAGSGWDPTDPTAGNAWENQAVFDHRGRPLPALATFAADPR